MWHRLEVAVAGSHYWNGVSRVLGELDLLERRVLDLAVFLDVPATEFADPLLHAVFHYGFVKGLAVARFGRDAGLRLAASQWLRTMPSTVDILQREALRRGLPLPQRDVAAVIAAGRADEAA